MNVPTIHTERLDLVSISPEWTELVLQGRRDEAARLGGFIVPAGWPDEQAGRRLRLQQQEMYENADRQEWLARAIGLRSSGEMIGRSGFHEPPLDGVAEIAYTVFELHRRNGYAEEAGLGLMDWARNVKDVRHFRLSIAPDNVASLGLASKLGFVRTGQQIDPEDGLEYVFELK